MPLHHSIVWIHPYNAPPYLIAVWVGLQKKGMEEISNGHIFCLIVWSIQIWKDLFTWSLNPIFFTCQQSIIQISHLAASKSILQITISMHCQVIIALKPSGFIISISSWITSVQAQNVSISSVIRSVHARLLINQLVSTSVRPKIFIIQLCDVLKGHF